nr:uncharacterized protein LOC109154689 [Ipomoea batatas]
MKVSVIHNSLLPMAKGTPPQGEEASSFHITLCDEIPIEGEDAEEAPHELEEGVRAAIDKLKEVDLGTPENPRPIFISTLLSDEDEEIYVELLKEYIDVFAWMYKEMPGLDPKFLTFCDLSPLRKAYLYLHLSAWESPECVSLFLWQKSQPLVMCRVVLEPQSQLLLGGPLVRQNPQGSSSSPIEGFEFQRAFVEHPQEHFAPNIALQLEFQLVYRIMFHKLDLSLNTSFERGNTFSWSFL